MAECAKRRYGTWEAARRAVIALARRRGSDVADAYRCRHCGHIHLTSRWAGV